MEGARTEEDYLIHWSRIYRTQVRVTIADERGVPATLVDLAITAKRDGAREERRGRGSAWDDIWISPPSNIPILDTEPVLSRR